MTQNKSVINYLPRCSYHLLYIKQTQNRFANTPTLVLTLLVKFAGKSQSFFDHEDLERIGEDGIYGANAPEIDSPQSQVTKFLGQL